MTLSKLPQKPQYIFAIFSLLVGFLLVFLMPPIGGIDESQHVRRAADISNFKFLNPENHTEDKLAIWAENALVLHNEAVEKKPRWNFDKMFAQISDLPKTLPADRQVSLDKNPYALSNPFMYAPFALVLNISNYLFHPEPWVQFYILRITGLLCSVFLITIAIARMPEHKTLLAAMCLLPAMMNARSGVNIDGLVIGSAFLFIGQVYRLYRKKALVDREDIFLLTIFAFIMAQSKGAYVPLLFLALLLPKGIFSSTRKYWLSLAMVIVPAMVVGLGWSDLAKNAVLAGMRYRNDVGDVWPDGQFEWLLTHPFSYIGVLLKTVFTSSMLPKSLWEAIGSIGWGHNFIVIPAVSYVLLIATMFAIMAYEPVKQSLQLSVAMRCFIIIVALATIAFALTMLYVQWSAYKSPVIDGFQGRYFYPLLPLFLIFIKPIAHGANSKRSTLLLWIFGIVSSLSLLWSTVSFYYL